MGKQQIAMHVVDCRDYGTVFRVTDLWNKQIGDGTTHFQEISEFLADGWKLHSITPITQHHGATSDLLFTFVRDEIE